MPVDKRKHERFHIKEHVNSPDSKVINGKNVSLGGICIIMENKLDIDTLIDMEFCLPGNSNKFTALAKVIWREKSDKGYETGLEFTKISVIQKERM